MHNVEFRPCTSVPSLEQHDDLCVCVRARVCAHPAVGHGVNKLLAGEGDESHAV